LVYLSTGSRLKEAHPHSSWGVAHFTFILYIFIVTNVALWLKIMSIRFYLLNYNNVPYQLLLLLLFFAISIDSIHGPWSCAFSALALLVGHQEEHPACKN